jgi:hypothetical protein
MSVILAQARPQGVGVTPFGEVGEQLLKAAVVGLEEGLGARQLNSWGWVNCLGLFLWEYTRRARAPTHHRLAPRQAASPKDTQHVRSLGKCPPPILSSQADMRFHCGKRIFPYIIYCAPEPK